MLYSDRMIEIGAPEQYLRQGPVVHRIPLYLNDYLNVIGVFPEDITLDYIPLFSVQKAKRLEQVEDFPDKYDLIDSTLFVLHRGCYVLLYPLDYAFFNTTFYE